MPTPNPNEPEEDFVSRCIPIVLEEGTAKDNKQAAAICYSMFAGLLVCWFAGLLVCWFAGLLIRAWRRVLRISESETA